MLRGVEGGSVYIGIFTRDFLLDGPEVGKVYNPVCDDGPVAFTFSNERLMG